MNTSATGAQSVQKVGRRIARAFVAPLLKEQADVRNLIKQLLGVGQAAATHNGKELKTVQELLSYIAASTSKYGIQMKPKKRR